MKVVSTEGEQARESFDREVAMLKKCNKADPELFVRLYAVYEDRDDNWGYVCRSPRACAAT